ncbi:MAG: hypothetical protein AAFZ80_06440 [Cyanobacteria bacterium P01_A01_bin.105]
MSQLKPMQQLILWNLLITGDEPKMSVFKPAARQPLLDQGFIRLEKRGRASHIVLEDKAWDWMNDQVQSPDFTVALPQRATTAIPVFEALLVRMGGYLRSQDIPIHEFLSTVGAAATQPIKETTEPLTTQIRQACEAIMQNSDDFRIRLSQLRQHLAPVPTLDLTGTLIQMQQSGQLSLRPMEDPQEITEADEAAAIDMGGKDKRYFIVLKD